MIYEYDFEEFEQLELDFGYDYSFEPEYKIDNSGHNCKDCGEFYPYAIANQLDGTLICYSCRIQM